MTEASAIDRIWSDHAGFPLPGGRLFRRKPKFARERRRDGRAAAGIDARRGCRDERLLMGGRFPLTRPSAGCWFRKETIARARRNRRDAPIAVIGLMASHGIRDPSRTPVTSEA